MRVYLYKWWANGLLQGIIYGAIMGTFYAHQKGSHNDLSPSLRGFIAGLIFGLVMGLVFRKRMARLRNEIGNPSDTKFNAALQAWNRGPVPEDPEVRSASAHIIRYQLSRVGTAKKANYIVFGLLAALGLWLVFSQGPIWWLAVALFVGAPGFLHWQAARIRRRAVLFGVDPR